MITTTTRTVTEVTIDWRAVGEALAEMIEQEIEHQRTLNSLFLIDCGHQLAVAECLFAGDTKRAVLKAANSDTAVRDILSQNLDSIGECVADFDDLSVRFWAL